MLSNAAVHEEVRARLRQLRARVGPRLTRDFDVLLERMRFLADDPETFFHPLTQPLVQFPMWVSSAVDASPNAEARLLDMIEACVAGYLYVRVHDDRLDDDVGDPDRAMFLADAFLVRHQVLVACSVGADPRFWELFEATAHAYSEAMLLEHEVLRPEAHYDARIFELVLRRSQPLVLPAAVMLSVADRWDLLEPLQRFVRYVVRSGQLVDDLLDCQRDLARGNHTWVVRRLGGMEGADAMLEHLLFDGIDALVGDVLADLDEAAVAARAVGMPDASVWVAGRYDAVVALRKKILLTALFG